MTSRATEHFFSLGLQYFVAGRFSAFGRLMPVVGNQFHHAVEMMLKGYLAKTMDLADLKKLGHRLVVLWERFKKDFADDQLARFDQTIMDLDQFESIRYPNQVHENGAQMVISLGPRHVWTENTGIDVPQYQVVLRELDELVKVIFTKSSINPPYYINGLNVDVKAMLLRENEFPLT